ncbi:MAG: hypothetical protein ACI4LB_03460 [Candidatus Fimenecus sp.]
MEEQTQPGYLPLRHRILWLVLRAGIMIWGIYGLFHGSTVEFLEAIFAILFTHMWDYFQVFGGNSFITRVDYISGTMLNLFIFIGVVVGTTLNNRTSFHSFDLVTHCCAGFIAAWFGYDFAVIMQGRYGRLSPALASMFSLCFSLGISVAWEIYEFTMDRLYGLALQCSTPISESGLIDTMVDFIIAAVGALAGMFTVAFYRNGKFGKHKKQIRARILREKKDAERKDRLWEAYVNEQDYHFD